MTTWTRNLRERPAFILLTSLTSLVLSVDAFSQTTPDPVGEAGAQYARIRHQEGSIVVIGDEGERSGDLLGINAPILPHDGILTRDGRVEIQLADGSLLRLDRATQVEARVLADLANQFENRTWLLQGAGRAYLYVERTDDSEHVFRLDTPTASVYFLTQGIFRVDVAEEDGRTTVSSHSGVAEVVAEGVSALVRSGDRTDVLAFHRPSDARPFNPYLQDAFDQWNRDRQAAYVKTYESLPASDVPPEIRPYVTELAYYGEWVQDTSYGWVWRPPAVNADWSPYLVGRWSYAPAGWLWVSSEPWGWAPYHYGRWDYHVRLGWVWIPGRVFSGAWVSWAWGPGYLGWCPLNYYNRAVVHVHTRSVPSHRAWVFVPQDQVHRRDLHRIAVPRVRTEEIRRTSQPIDRAPIVQPRQVASTPPRTEPPAGTRAVPIAADDGALVSFRTLEGRGKFRSESSPGRATPSAQPPARSVDFRPGTTVRTPVPSTGTTRDRGGAPVAAPAPEPAGAPTAAPRQTVTTVPRATPPPQTPPPLSGREPVARPAPEPTPTPGVGVKPPETTEPRVRVIPTEDRRDLLEKIFRADPSRTPTVARPRISEPPKEPPPQASSEPPKQEPQPTASPEPPKKEPPKASPEPAQKPPPPPPRKAQPKQPPPKKDEKKDDGRH